MRSIGKQEQGHSSLLDLFFDSIKFTFRSLIVKCSSVTCELERKTYFLIWNTLSLVVV